MTCNSLFQTLPKCTCTSQTRTHPTYKSAKIYSSLICGTFFLHATYQKTPRRLQIEERSTKKGKSLFQALGRGVAAKGCKKKAEGQLRRSHFLFFSLRCEKDYLWSKNMNLVTFRCQGCQYFRKGKCLCYMRKEGPHGYKDCRTCRCCVISYILSTKKHTQKIFYHLRRAGKRCSCKLICKLRSDGLPCQRRGPKGKSSFTFHKNCASGYKQCSQMRKLQKNFNEFEDVVKHIGKVVIPRRCIPFLGTKQRNFKEFENSFARCQKKREAVAQKTKLKLSWTAKHLTSEQPPAQNSEISETSNESSLSSESSLEIKTDAEADSDGDGNSDHNDNSFHVSLDLNAMPLRLNTPNILEKVPSECNSEPEENANVCINQARTAARCELSQLSEEEATNAERLCDSDIEERNNSHSDLESSFQHIMSFLAVDIERDKEGVKEILQGDACPYSGIDEYFGLLQSNFPTVFCFATFFLNEILLACKKVRQKKLRGFAYKAALKNPWNYTLSSCSKELKLYKQNTGEQVTNFIYSYM